MLTNTKPLACCTCLVIALGAGGAACATRSVTLPDVPVAPAHTLRRFSAPEASQAVAVDDRFFYAIGSAAIGKYDKATGNRIAAWTPGGPAHFASEQRDHRGRRVVLRPLELP
jgi:hypothetical protein